MCTNSQNEFEPRKKSKGTGNSHDVVELLNSSSDEGDEEFSSNYFNDGANARKREVGRKRKQESGRGVDEERSGGGTKKGHVLKTKDEDELRLGLMEERKAWISVRKEGDKAEEYKKVFYWHVLDTALCTAIAVKCPTSIDELREEVTMAEEKISEYGEEIVFFVNNFIATNNLGDFIDSKHESKKIKASSKQQQQQQKKKQKSSVNLNNFRMDRTYHKMEED